MASSCADWRRWAGEEVVEVSLRRQLPHLIAFGRLSPAALMLGLACRPAWRSSSSRVLGSPGHRMNACNEYARDGRWREVPRAGTARDQAAVQGVAPELRAAAHPSVLRQAWCSARSAGSLGSAWGRAPVLPGDAQALRSICR